MPTEFSTVCDRCGFQIRLTESWTNTPAGTHWHTFLITCINRYQERVNELETLLRAAQADVERLDWVDARAFTAYQQRDPYDGKLEHAVLVDEDASTTPGTSPPSRFGIVRENIRGCIDEARQRSEQKRKS